MKQAFALCDSSIGQSVRAETILDNLLKGEKVQGVMETDIEQTDCEEGNLHTPREGSSTRKPQD